MSKPKKRKQNQLRKRNIRQPGCDSGEKPTREDILNRPILELRDSEGFTKRYGRNSLELELTRAVRQPSNKNDSVGREREQKSQRTLTPQSKRLHPGEKVEGLVRDILLDGSRVLFLVASGRQQNWLISESIDLPTTISKLADLNGCFVLFERGTAEVVRISIVFDPRQVG